MLRVYKKDTCISTRKPKTEKIKDFIVFNVENKNDEKKKLSIQEKEFLKNIVTDKKELNFIRNDICFLINELYKRDHSVSNVTIEKGVMFFIWVFFPFEWSDHEKIPENIKTDVFFFDLFFLRREITKEQVKSIVETISKTKITIFTRKINEIPVLPFKIKALF